MGWGFERREPIESSDAKSARLHAILEEIAAHACEPDFRLQMVARKVGVTDRYVRKLLAETGKSFSECKLELRLNRAFQLLSDPACAHRSVTEISLVSGFSDVSHFNRCFRERFGATPTAARPAKRNC